MSEFRCGEVLGRVQSYELAWPTVPMNWTNFVEILMAKTGY